MACRCAMPSGTNLIISPDAEVDIRDILRYTLETWGRPQRNAYFSNLKQAARRIQTFPEIGREREDGVREYAIRQHVILYRHEGDAVTILRVMHPRRLRD